MNMKAGKQKRNRDDDDYLEVRLDDNNEAGASTTIMKKSKTKKHESPLTMEMTESNDEEVVDDEKSHVQNFLELKLFYT